MFTKELLSGSTDGQPITIGTTNVTIHTADATAKDEVWIYAHNIGADDKLLTLTFGGGYPVKYTVPKQDGLKVIIPGLVLTNSKVVQALAETAGYLAITGYVNRITA